MRTISSHSEAVSEIALAKSSPQARQLRELEKELRRKDKALGEAAALLIP